MAGKLPPFVKKGFEQSGADKESGKYGKEGSPAEEAFDAKQAKAKRFAKGGGIESKGKTQGKIITMKRGGRC